MTTKAPNYTEAQEIRLADVYNPASSEAERETQIEELANEFGKATKSVRAKLSSMKLYVKKEYKSKAGNKAETKEVIVQEIATILGVDAEQLGGLEKATKNALNLIRGTFRVLAKQKIRS